MSRFTYFLLAAASVCSLALATPSGASTVVLTFGDSITHGLGDGSVGCQGASGGYPPRLSSRLEGRGLANTMRTFGVCGELTSQGVSRIDQVLASNADGDVIVLMEGTNDLSNNSISTESVLFNLRTMALKSLAAGVRPVLASVIPRAPEAGTNTRTAFLRALLEMDTEENDFDFADQYSQLININNLYSLFYTDAFHPNSQGYGLLADNFVDATLSAANRPVEVEPCELGDENLCLNQDRFKIEVSWVDFEGDTGNGQAVRLTPDTGYFWFFDAANVELIIKVLDGQEFNDMFWVFYGALSTVEYTITVTDTVTNRRKIYFNPLDKLASVGDTAAFPGDSGQGSVSGSPQSSSSHLPSAPLVPSLVTTVAAMETCVEDAETMCLNGGRFQVRSRWTDFAGKSGTGKAEVLSDETGYFWFFDAANVEVVVKALDGRAFNGAYWVFYGALSNVEFEVEVTDSITGERVLYTNPSGNFGSRADTEAFPEPAE